jgi:hypothetical protein
MSNSGTNETVEVGYYRAFQAANRSDGAPGTAACDEADSTAGANGHSRQDLPSSRSV